MASYHQTTRTGTAHQSLAIDNNRRRVNCGDRVIELEPRRSPLFVYTRQITRAPNDDSVFQMLEQRHQWQRRNVYNVDAKAADDPDGAILALAVKCMYDQYGRTVTTGVQPKFLLAGQNLAMEGVNDATGLIEFIVFNITAVDLTTDATEANLTVTVHSVNGDTTAANWPATMTIAADRRAQVIGTAFAENTGAPDGWSDKLYDRIGQMQIFKTACDQMSGTATATRFRGKPDEFARIWGEKTVEHVCDIEQAFLFGVGKTDESGGGTANTAPKRYTWGIAPYTELYGKVYPMTYAASGFDAFVDAMEDFFAIESGNSPKKLCLTSRKIISYFNKLGANGFLGNSLNASSIKFDIKNFNGVFGHKLTGVSCVHGDLIMVEEPYLRGMYEDYAVMVDLNNVAYRYLNGNGVNRDTFIKTNIQDNDADGRKDLITSEVGLEIDFPETHGILKFS